MSDNIKLSGADAPEQSFLEKNLKKGRIKLFFDADLKPCLSSPFKHDIHPNRRVPWWSLKIWEKRGFKPLKRGVAHVRFEDSDKKYVFPAYFWYLKKVEP